MITVLVYKCRVCGRLFDRDASAMSGAEPLMVQVSYHECPEELRVADDGDEAFGMADLVAFHRTREAEDMRS